MVNLSVWRDYPSLHDFVYRGDHAGLLRHLRAHGPTPQAFSLTRQLTPEGAPVRPGDLLRR